MADIVERLRSSEPLPACPYDKLSPHYRTAPDDKPCAVCGGLNDPDAPDLCRGADTRVMGEAADEIEHLRKLNEKLHVIAKNVSHALMSFTPGGSEYFTRVKIGDFEDYYADADVCQRRVRERITKAEDRARDAFRPLATGKQTP